jgi:hypothetical protein
MTMQRPSKREIVEAVDFLRARHDTYADVLRKHIMWLERSLHNEERIFTPPTPYKKTKKKKPSRFEAEDAKKAEEDYKAAARS